MMYFGYIRQVHHFKSVLKIELVGLVTSNMDQQRKDDLPYKIRFKVFSFQA